MYVDVDLGADEDENDSVHGDEGADVDVCVGVGLDVGVDVHVDVHVDVNVDLLTSSSFFILRRSPFL